MNKTIKLFYYKSKSGRLNFGDELSPEIVNYITGLRVQRVNRNQCNLIAIGSILDKQLKFYNQLHNRISLKMSDPVFVWGSGLIINKKIKKPFFITLALRGKFTENNLDLSTDLDIPLGDPALFVNNMLGLQVKRSGIGIVPHYTDKNHPIINDLKNIQNVKIIDVERNGSEVSSEIATCDFIISSSLHGLVVADSFGIPNYRVKLFDNLKGGNFKFRDYASALGRKDIKPYELSFPKDIFTIIRSETDFGYQSNIDEICTRLEKALKKFF